MMSVLRFIALFFFLLLNFNHGVYLIFQPSTIFRKFGVTYKDCFDFCIDKPKCAVSLYRRRFSMCELFTAYDGATTRIPGLRICRRQIWTNQPTECSDCLENEICRPDNNGVHDCIAFSCGKPDHKIGTTILGNIHSFGSKIKYKCDNGDQNDFRILLCHSDGSWSTFPQFCTCLPPQIPHGTTSIGQLSNGTKTALITCDLDYELRQKQTPTCDPLLNVWVNIDEVYCNRMIDGQWRKIYSYPNNRHPDITSIKIHWKTKTEPEYIKHLYRNHTFIDNGTTQGLVRVRLSIISNDTEAAYVIFDGSNSNHWSWFAKERLLYSSWEDLKERTDIEYISWSGITEYNETSGKVHLRHYINKVYNEPNCSANMGWFVVTWGYFPCGGTDLRPIILYSKSRTTSRFVNNEIGVADRFEVWVNYV